MVLGSRSDPVLGVWGPWPPWKRVRAAGPLLSGAGQAPALTPDRPGNLKSKEVYSLDAAGPMKAGSVEGRRPGAGHPAVMGAARESLVIVSVSESKLRRFALALARNLQSRLVSLSSSLKVILMTVSYDERVIVL